MRDKWRFNDGFKVNPNAVKALKEKEKKKNKDEVKKDKSRSREKEESDAQKKLASMKKKGADKMKLKQAAKRVWSVYHYVTPMC